MWQQNRLGVAVGCGTRVLPRPTLLQAIRIALHQRQEELDCFVSCGKASPTPACNCFAPCSRVDDAPVVVIAARGRAAFALRPQQATQGAFSYTFNSSKRVCAEYLRLPRGLRRR